MNQLLKALINESEHSKQNSEWPEPKPIQNELLPVEPLAPEIIPAPYRDWITDISHRMQCPLDFVAIPAIILTSAIIGAGCGVRPKRRDTWLVIPNLWGGIVGRPGKLKTPAIAEPLQTLERLSAKAKEDYDEACRVHDADIAVLEVQQSGLKAKFRRAAEKQEDVQSLKSELLSLPQPDAPIWRRYKTNDATIEKMSELLADNPRGILLFRDELIGLLASWDKSGHETDRAFFLEAWNGYGSIDTDRIGRGTIHTENLCISVLGGIQPAKLISYLYQAMNGLENDGMLQRFQLLVYPDDKKVWELIDQQPNHIARLKAFEIVEKLADLDFVGFGAILDEGAKVPFFHFTAEAQELFYEWLTELEKEKLQATDEPIMLEHLSKYRSLMPSLALIFHLIEVVDGKASGPITLRATELAAAWCEYLESHARRIYGLVGDMGTQAAANLAKRIQNNELQNGFTARDVYRKGWSFLNTSETAELACEKLVEAEWLREQVIEPALRQRGKTTYLINPRVRRKDG